ncbi:hypothetical protein BDB01DRAFT_586527 [Pilobolus umbonatus]|nr:hypothetical protein BDB01DRAFT_586527 [Pilobolus umbonatus]
MDAPRDTIANFTRDRHVRSSWIAFFTLFILWGLSYIIRHVLPEKRRAVPAHPNTANVDLDGTHPAGTTGKPYTKYSVTDRLRHAHDVLKENTLMLLSVLALNTFGMGGTRSVSILAWIFFAVTAVYALVAAAFHHNLIRMVMNLILFGVAIAIGALAFKHGW